MLKVDLGQLQGGARLRIDARVPNGDPLLNGSGLDLEDGVQVALEAQRAGDDIVVRGEIEGANVVACRRCLAPVRAEFRAPVTLVFRPAPGGGDLDEVYPLPERARELDLGPAIREHVLLAVPEFVQCREDCAGLCPRCGADLNQGPCSCTVEEIDERWAALKRLRPEG